jgi:hypothetical protein
MHIDPNIKTIVLTVIAGGIFYWLNATFNNVPKLKQVVSAIIIVISVLVVLVAGWHLFEAL